MKRRQSKMGLGWATKIGIGIVVIFFLFFATTSIIIGMQINSACNDAVSAFESDCPTSLAMILDDDDLPYPQRNRAIWALGQFGKEENVPVLQAYYTGEIPAKEPLDQDLSQYELKKAIELSEGKPNLTKIIWSWWINQ